MNWLKENWFKIIVGFAILVFSLSFLYRQYLLTVSHDEKIYRYCLENAGFSTLNLSALQRLAKETPISQNIQLSECLRYFGKFLIFSRQ